MKKKRISVLASVCTGLTVIMALAWLFPVYWILATALKSETQTIALPPSFVPFPPDFGGSRETTVSRPARAGWHCHHGSTSNPSLALS